MEKNPLEFDDNDNFTLVFASDESNNSQDYLNISHVSYKDSDKDLDCDDDLSLPALIDSCEDSLCDPLPVILDENVNNPQFVQNSMDLNPISSCSRLCKEHCD